MSPGLKSTKRNGPVPTGFRLFGASRDLSPLYAWNRCFGMTCPYGPQKGDDQKGVGDLKTIFTVWLSSLSIRTISRYWPTLTAAVAGSMTYSQLKTTSSAVKGLPSCHATFFFSRQVTDRPSFATSPFWRLGTSAARTGMMLPSGS